MTAPEDKSRLKRPPCSAANSVLETDLQIAVQQQTLENLKVLETPEGFYVIAQFLWATDKDWYLATRRNRIKPRIFKDLNRLNDHLKAAFPSNGFELIRNQKLPPKERPPSTSMKSK